MMKKLPKLARRTFLGVSASAAAAGIGTVIPGHGRDDCQFGCAPMAIDRLDQGPFDINQDEGWRTLTTTTPSSAHIRNYGLGLVGYTWEETVRQWPRARDWRRCRKQ